MFLVEVNRYGTTHLVFTWEDPRKDGYKGSVVENVHLDYDMNAVHRWPDGYPRPEACVGQASGDPKQYKVFPYSSQLRAEHYQPVAGKALVFGSWSDYVRLNPDPEYLENIPEEEWFERLDEYDEGARRRRRRAPEPDSPAGGSRDDVAAWVAKQHFLVDSGVREIWYLPQGAPSEEIRLLEVSDRLGEGESRAEAIDFGLNVGGSPFRLSVADVTSDLLEQIQADPARLPAGWFLDGKQVWPRRRGA